MFYMRSNGANEEPQIIEISERAADEAIFLSIIKLGIMYADTKPEDMRKNHDFLTRLRIMVERAKMAVFLAMVAGLIGGAGTIITLGAKAWIAATVIEGQQ